MFISHVKPVTIFVFRRIKIPTYELVDFITVIRIKIFALYAELSFDGFSAFFIGVRLDDLVVVGQSWIVAFTLGLEEVLDFAPRLAWCMIIFRRAGVVTPSKLPPPPYEQILPLPIFCFKKFLERSLNPF